MLSRAAHRLASHLFGGTCVLCRGAADVARDEGLLCAACDADLPRLSDALCPRCALASPRGALCGRCLSRPPAYDATVAALEYRFPCDILVHALKFRGELALATPLGRLLGERVARAGEHVDWVLPVPLSEMRLRTRGYNQSLEIARHAARALGARLAAHVCERNRDTPPQSALDWDERAKNVRGAFRCTVPLERKTVAVVDDVMTTGATLQEIAGTLKRAGAARVVNWVVARTFFD